MKFPGTYYAYALILAIFGQSIWGIHVGLLVLHLATCLVLFLLIRRFFGALPAGLGAAGFAILGLDRWIMGIFAHATHFVLLPALTGLLLLLHALESRRLLHLFAAGVLLGTAVLMKQHGIFFLLLGGILVLWSALQQQPRNIKVLVTLGCTFGAGAATALAVIVAVLAAQGVLARCWFWTIQYASTYVTEKPLKFVGQSFLMGWQTVTQANLFIWLFAALGLVLLWIGKWPLRSKIFISLFLVFSFLSIVPGFYFRPHYFILLLPAAAFGIAASVASIDLELRRMIPGVPAQILTVLVFLAVASPYFIQEKNYLTTMSPNSISRSRYGENPFIEAVEIAAYLKKHTMEDDQIAILGSEPEIYFYANRRSATGYIYTYPLMEPQPYALMMQNEMMDEIEESRPKYLVVVDISPSWTARPSSNPRILYWMTRYWQRCYQVVGIAAILRDGTTEIRWESEATGYEPDSEWVIHTLLRTNSEPCTAPRD